MGFVATEETKVAVIRAKMRRTGEKWPIPPKKSCNSP
jgi:hypothetical protein